MYALLEHAQSLGKLVQLPFNFFANRHEPFTSRHQKAQLILSNAQAPETDSDSVSVVVYIAGKVEEVNRIFLSAAGIEKRTFALF